MSAQPAGAVRSPQPILVVEADPRLGGAMAEQLGADGYCVQVARTREHARVLAGASTPRLAVLGSVESPHGALGLLREIRDHADDCAAPWDRGLPVILLEPHACALDLLRAFDAGADDVLVGATKYLELRARMRAILRRVERSMADGARIEVGPLVLDRCTRTVHLHDRPLKLRRMEFTLLAQLASDPQRVFTRDELLRSVWGYHQGACTRTLDTHASRLRRKLAAQDGRAWVINVWGIGYRLT
jgi:DNA-binding response OmpR family regulator